MLRDLQRQTLRSLLGGTSWLWLLAAACLLLWLGAEPLLPGAPLIAFAFGSRPGGEQESLWGEEPEGSEQPAGDGEDPFDAALGRREGTPLPNPFGARSPRAEEQRGEARAQRERRREAGGDDRAARRRERFARESADAPRAERESAGPQRAWSTGGEEGGAPEGLLHGLRLRVSRIVSLLIVAGIAASFLPIGEGVRGLAGILRPILRDPFNANASPWGLPTLLFALAMLITVASSLRAIIEVVGGTRAAAAIRRAIRKGATSTPFDDGDGQGGLFEGVSLRELLLARRKRGEK